MELLAKLVQVPMVIWKILWWRRVSTWAWSTVTSFEHENSKLEEAH